MVIFIKLFNPVKHKSAHTKKNRDKISTFHFPCSPCYSSRCARHRCGYESSRRGRNWFWLWVSKIAGCCELFISTLAALLESRHNKAVGINWHDIFSHELSCAGDRINSVFICCYLQISYTVAEYCIELQLKLLLISVWNFKNLNLPGLTLWMKENIFIRCLLSFLYANKIVWQTDCNHGKTISQSIHWWNSAGIQMSHLRSALILLQTSAHNTFLWS